MSFLRTKRRRRRANLEFMSHRITEIACLYQREKMRVRELEAQIEAKS